MTSAAPSRTILIVEPDVIVRMATSTYLRECGYKVVEASGAEEATRLLETDLTVNIVFTEIEMPGGMDGFALATWVRRARPGTKVILTSTIKRTVEEAGDLCEQGPHLVKPYHPHDLERHIRRLLALDLQR
jgi:CheY-like chemotaxis protein